MAIDPRRRPQGLDLAEGPDSRWPLTAMQIHHRAIVPPPAKSVSRGLHSLRRRSAAGRDDLQAGRWNLLASSPVVFRSRRAARPVGAQGAGSENFARAGSTEWRSPRSLADPPARPLMMSAGGQRPSKKKRTRWSPPVPPRFIAGNHSNGLSRNQSAAGKKPLLAEWLRSASMADTIDSSARFIVAGTTISFPPMFPCLNSRLPGSLSKRLRHDLSR